MPNEGRSRALAVLGLAVFTLVPSFDSIAKYFGAAGIALYCLVGIPAVFAAYYIIWPFVERSLSERTALILAAATLLALVIEVSVGYPFANSGRFGPGSDVDDALIITVGEFVKGNYPYYARTYLGLSPSPLPGSILLAIPWVVLGAVQLQNVFWLVVQFFVLRHIMKSGVKALALFWGLLLLSPTIHQSLLTGSDYISNTVYVLVAAWLVLVTVTDDEGAGWREVAAAVFFGLTLSSRSNFILLLPTCFLTLTLAGRWKRAFRSAVVATATFVLVTIPFWAFDPAGFTPTSTQAARLTWLNNVLPFSGQIIPGIAAAILIALTFRKRGIDPGWFFLNNGIAQLFLIVATATVYSVGIGRLDLFMGNSGYGLFGLFFGAAGCWLILDRMDTRTDRQLDEA